MAIVPHYVRGKPKYKQWFERGFWKAKQQQLWASNIVNMITIYLSSIHFDFWTEKTTKTRSERRSVWCLCETSSSHTASKLKQMEHGHCCCYGILCNREWYWFTVSYLQQVHWTLPKQSQCNLIRDTALSLMVNTMREAETIWCSLVDWHVPVKKR